MFILIVIGGLQPLRRMYPTQNFGTATILGALIALARLGAASPAYAVVFSAGQTDYAVLQAAPASSALYGFAYPASEGTPPIVNVTLTAPNGSIVATVRAASASAGSGNVCDASWYVSRFSGLYYCGHTRPGLRHRIPFTVTMLVISLSLAQALAVAGHPAPWAVRSGRSSRRFRRAIKHAQLQRQLLAALTTSPAQF